jgi:RNA polymerase sigma-70 factor (ECF subfamily)
MASTNNKKGEKKGASRAKGRSMQTGVLEQSGVAVGRKAKADPVREIVERCKAGDPAAFRDLFDRHVAGVHRHLSLLIGPGGDVDDLVQLVFLNVFQSIGRFRGASAFSTWLFRITINVARQEIRVRGRHRRLSGALGEASKVQGTSVRQTPENRLSTWQEIYEVLDRLSDKKRETFILYMYEGYSLEEIARLLGSSVSTIGSRLQSARKEIVSILGSKRRR